MAVSCFVAATDSGVARMRRANGDWTVDEPLGGVSVTSISTGGVGSNQLLAGTTNAGVIRSDDGGSTWESCGLDEERVMAVTLAPGRPDRMYAGIRPPGVYRSDDGGDTWIHCDGFQQIRGRRVWRSPASPPFTAYVNGLAVSPTDADLVVAGIEYGAVVRSTDGGRSWSNHRRKAIRDCHDLVWHATDGDCVYEAGAGIPRRPGARSADKGATWVKPGGGLDRGYGVAVAADPADTKRWYVAASTSPFAADRDENPRAAVFRHDGRDTWTKLESFHASSMPWALCTDPAQPDHLWAGCADGSIQYTADAGASWDRLDGELPSVRYAMAALTTEK